MGAWGVEPLENDAALDVAYLWKEWVDKLALPPENAVDRFLKHWGDALNYGDSVTNMEVIALSAILHDRAIPIPNDLRAAAVDAANRELQQEVLAEWENPDERRRSLLATLAQLGGRQKAPRTPRVLRDPALCFRHTAAATRELARLSHRRKREQSAALLGTAALPSFLQVLSRLFNHRVWEKDSNIWEQARRERLMMLAWFLAEHLKMPPEERDELIERCARWPAG